MENLSILAPFSELIKEAFTLCRKLAYRLFGVVTVGFAAMYLNFVIFLSLYRSAPVLASALAFLVALFIYQIFRLALVRSLVEEKGALEAYRFSFRKFGSYLLANFFSFLSVLGGLPAVIPGISLYHSYFLIPFVIASEGKNGIEASLRSREYVAGFWWESLGRRLSVLFLVILAYVIISLPSGALGPVWVAASNLALIFLIYPFLAAFDLSVYRHLAYKRSSLKGSPILPGAFAVPYISSGLGAGILLVSLLYILFSPAGFAALTSVLIYLSVIFALFIF